MKKVLMLAGMLPALFAWGQKSNVESAAIYFRNLEIEDAKKVIDDAAAHEETKNDPKTWFYYAQIYDTISRNPIYQAMDKDYVEKFLLGCKKCVDLDAKKRYEYYCSYAIVNSAFGAYNKAIEFYQQDDAKNAAKFFQYVIDVFPYDKNKDLTKNNINEKSIIYSMAGLAIKNKDYTEAKRNLNKLIEMDYQEPAIYIFLSNIYLEEDKDTTTALGVIEKGRLRFPGEKDLVNQELNIYMAQGKQDVLLTKLNETLSNDPDNVTLLYVRGNVYDNLSSTALKNAKTYKDTSNILSKKAKTEKIPANKTKLESASKYYSKASDSLYKAVKHFTVLGEADYKHAVEVKDDYLDAYFNLGALTNNKTADVVEKMNAIPTSAPDYQKKWNALKKIQDSILNVALGHFNKAIDLAEALPETDEQQKIYKLDYKRSIYYSLQQVYANLGDEKKTMEMMKLRRETEALLPKQ